jgi:vacuolar-type H+-ATPase subunit H
MSLEQRTKALLDLVKADRDTVCAAIVGDATAQASALVAKARADARRLVAQAFADERARVQAELDAARADLQTRRRLHAQHQLDALLALAWQRLPQTLRRRWADPAGRRAWIAQAQAQARTLLGNEPWTVQHSTDTPPDAIEAWFDIAPPPRFETDARIDAGLRIVAGANVVDATLDGLLADRDEIGGRLVGWLQAQVLR